MGKKKIYIQYRVYGTTTIITGETTKKISIFTHHVFKIVRITITLQIKNIPGS